MTVTLSGGNYGGQQVDLAADAVSYQINGFNYIKANVVDDFGYVIFVFAGLV